MKIELNDRFINNFVSVEELEQIQPQITLADQLLRGRTGAGSEYTDWLDWPNNISQAEINKIKEAAKKIQGQSEVLVVIGIGGSYLGARAVVEFLSGSFPNNQKTQIVFAGNSLSGAYYQELIDWIGDRDFSVNVISKSGTTTEPAIGFRVFKDLLDKKYGEKSKEHIYATTDAAKGTLHDFSITNNYESFEVPDGIGGRFSVLTAVGLLPIAVAGINIEDLLMGAKDAVDELQDFDIQNNPAAKYAAYRNILLRKNFTTEIFASFEPTAQFVAEWWKQLMGESEGKNATGIFPTSVSFTTDLHSMGQYIQEGRRDLFETVVQIKKMRKDITVPIRDDNDDQLEYLQGRSLTDINNMAIEAVLLAHNDGGVPAILLEVERQDAYNLGYLIQFFELAVGLSGYVNAVNPFNQPGVEAYKQNIFALLGKPGYEELAKKIKGDH